MHSNDSDVGGNDNDLFLPIDNSLLPRLQDSSWLDARVSPVPHNDEDDEENDEITAPYRKALNESLVMDEKSALLGNRSSLHPLWGRDDAFKEQEQQKKRKSMTSVGKMVLRLTGSLQFFIILHDAYLWYLAYRRGIEPVYSIRWRLPWLSPSERTLVRFGAFCPARLWQWWRPVTSLFFVTSVMEWLGIAWAWWDLDLKRQQSSWLYFVSAISGQLWMIAFHPNGVSGCASWGTCGVLTFVGAKLVPDRRFALFLTAIALIVLNLLQPSSSAFGAIGAAFFGWSYAGAFPTNTISQKDDAKKEWKCLQWFAILVLIMLWILPISVILLT